MGRLDTRGATVAHLHFRQTVYKSGGSAAAGRVAYISRQPVKALDRADQQLRYLGVTEGPQRREDLVATTSHNLPAWADGKPHTYFAAAERYEGVDRVAFTEWKITLPRELSHRENLALAHDLLDASFGTTHPYTYAFHDPVAVDGERQPHLHVLWSGRSLDGIDRQPAQFFKRWNAHHPERGGARKDPALNHLGAVFAARQMLCDITNVHLEQHGHAARLDPRSLEERGIDRTPEPKLLPSDSHALKHRFEVTPSMQHVFAHRHERMQHEGAEQAQAQRSWERRELALGLTPGMTMEASLQRIRQARAQAITRTPERRSVSALDHEAQTLEHSIGGLQTYTQRVQAELVIEGQFQHDYQRPQDGQRRAERVLAEGREHGLPRDHGAEQAVRLLAHLSHEEEPTAGAALHVRIYGRDERDQDRGMSW